MEGGRRKAENGPEDKGRVVDSSTRSIEGGEVLYGNENTLSKVS